MRATTICRLRRISFHHNRSDRPGDRSDLQSPDPADQLDGEGLMARGHLLGPLGVTPILAGEVQAMIDSGGAELR